ncbi:50S ribosomal protein L24e [Candidatus Woesearchaeota archaeon]|nr:50S ribosomal protein L24e [Candidatus Woesearchaeota archaeon]RLE40748.1 MAG: 50S ribosomal protein L24e [Candidatus Woesearchaeota archaeon]
MPKCSFCGSELKTGTGKMFVKRDGKILYFCSKKCEKNMLKLKRNPSKVKWIIKKKKERKG